MLGMMVPAYDFFFPYVLRKSLRIQVYNPLYKYNPYMRVISRRRIRYLRSRYDNAYHTWREQLRSWGGGETNTATHGIIDIDNTCAECETKNFQSGSLNSSAGLRKPFTLPAIIAETNAGMCRTDADVLHKRINRSKDMHPNSKLTGLGAFADSPSACCPPATGT